MYGSSRVTTTLSVMIQSYDGAEQGELAISHKVGVVAASLWLYHCDLSVWQQLQCPMVM